MKILSAKPRSAFRVALSFDNGEAGVVDLSFLAGRGVFAAWNQPGFFEQASISPDGALEWPGEIDLCPDALYLRMTGKPADEVFPTLRNPLYHA